MNKLEELLAHCDEEYRADILSAIEAHFAEGLAQGRSEEEIVAELGDPREIAGAAGESDGREGHGPGPEGDGFFNGSFSGTVTSFVNQTVNSFVKGILGTVQRGVDAASGVNWTRFVNRERSYTPVQNGEAVTAVVISGTSVDVTVEPGSEEEILFDYDPADGPEAMLTVEGSVLAISSAEEWRGLSGSLWLRLPARVRALTLDLTSGDTRVHGLALDALSFRTTSGDVDLRQIETGEMNFTAASGDLDASGLRRRDLSIRAASGDVSFEGCAEYGNINTASGDVEVVIRENTESIRVNTASGDVDLRVPESAGVLFRTVSGEVSTSRPRTRGPGGTCIGRDVPIRAEVTTVSGDLSV